MSSKEHWENVYGKGTVDKLGWYQKCPQQSIDLINSTKIDKNNKILVIGGGATTLIDNLLFEEYKDIIVADISEIALNILKSRLGENASKITWIVDDVTKPTELQKLRNIVLWQDRALLHFLVEKDQRDAYIELMNKIVVSGGFVIIAVFAIGGAKKCSGLDVINYSVNMLIELLGSNYKLIESFDHVYITPSEAERPYIYTLFKKLR